MSYKKDYLEEPFEDHACLHLLKLLYSTRKHNFVSTSVKFLAMLHCHCSTRAAITRVKKHIRRVDY